MGNALFEPILQCVSRYTAVVNRPFAGVYSPLRMCGRHFHWKVQRTPVVQLSTRTKLFLLILNDVNEIKNIVTKRCLTIYRHDSKHVLSV